jgi:DNA-directed RNA polymerase beta' subunit
VLRRSGSNGDGSVLVETTLGRLLFNEAFPVDFRFKDRLVRKRDTTEIVGELVENYTKAEVATSLDKLKELGFEYSTRAGLTISIADVRTPRRRPRSSTSTRRTPRRSSSSTTAASSPTTSDARRRSRSGPTPPTR